MILASLGLFKPRFWRRASERVWPRDISLGVHSVLVWERLVLSQLVCGICLANCKDGVWDITGGG